MGSRWEDAGRHPGTLCGGVCPTGQPCTSRLLRSSQSILTCPGQMPSPPHFSAEATVAQRHNLACEKKGWGLSPGRLEGKRMLSTFPGVEMRVDSPQKHNCVAPT